MSDAEEILRAAESLEPTDRLRLIARIWATMPPDHWAAPTPKEQREIERRLGERDFDAIGDASWKIATRLLGDHKVVQRPVVYSAPRRFDLATIFVVTTAYAILLGGLSAAGAWPIVSVVIAAFITFVGIGQATLFGGERPRSASMLVGTVLHTTAIAALWLTYGRLYPTAVILIGTGYSVIGGVILGYAAGAFVGGVFLCADILRRRFRRQSSPSPEIGQE